VAARTARRGKDDDRAGDHLRLCAASRAERPVEDLIRFVAAPDGSITADLARELPGRGVWVTADRASVETAVKGKVFARSLKRQVTVRPDLAQATEDLLVKRAMDTLSLANKAGLVLAGFDKVKEALDTGDIALLVHGADASHDGRDKLDRKFQAVQGAMGKSAEMSAEFSIVQLSLAMGRSNVVHAALIHGGVTDKFMAAAGRLKRYRLGVDPPVCNSMNATPAPIQQAETDIA
jgi:predicted RNA-binding protein YlxR (DUF448 family)